MKYRIGDVSKMLHISDQMIRYYEKNGVIHPERSGDGQYRLYSEMDVFLLFEAMKYKEWDISILEINDMISNDYYTTLIERLGIYEKKLAEEARMRNAMLQRVARVRRKLKLSRYNVGHIAVDILPECELFFMGESQGESYDIYMMDEEMASIVYSSEYVPFFDPYVEYDGNNGTWWYLINSDLAEMLELPEHGRHRHLEEQAVLTTFIDMGDPGEFTPDKYLPLQKYAEENGYETAGPMCGVIVGRGNEGDHFRRMMQMVLPIRTL